MPAAVVKGIIVSISIIAALGIAVLENPQVQVWLEVQRKKIAELLGSIGEELDPASRRTAEAFAYEGRTPGNDAGLRRELSGSTEAAAVATGRTLSNPGTIRRIPISGPTDPDAAEERKRQGKIYLAQREKQMIEMQQRRKTSQDRGLTPTSPTFDSFVDEDGKLKSSLITEKELPSPPAMEPLPDHVTQDMKEVERNLEQPMMAEASNSSMSAFQMGSRMADPFGDEFALDRSMTPKPPVPPKVRLDATEPEVPVIPGSFSPPTPLQQPHENDGDDTDNDALTYEEQLAIALSISESESVANTATIHQNQNADDNELLAAIAASLKDMDDKQASHAVSHTGATTPKASSHSAEPLVDLSPSEPSDSSTKTRAQASGGWLKHFELESSPPQEPITTGASEDWFSAFAQKSSASQEPMTKKLASVTSEDTDELYSVTPQLTRARLAVLERQQGAPLSSSSNTPYDPVRDAVARQLQTPQPALDASFYSAPESIEAPSVSAMDRETPQVVDATESTLPEGARTPTVKDDRSSFGFHTDTESSQAASRPESVISGLHVVEAVEDSDADVLSEDEEGIMTPDSWTEVGSEDEDESEAGGIERHLESSL